MNYDDLLWKCQGILGSQDYMRLAGLIVAEKELRHSKKMLEETLKRYQNHNDGWHPVYLGEHNNGMDNQK